MTDPVQTVVHDPARASDGASVSVAEIQPDDPTMGRVGDLFHDDAWAEEFDRRLAAWEAESPAASPVTVARPR